MKPPAATLFLLSLPLFAIDGNLGLSQPVADVLISAASDGRIERIRVAEGDFVREGDVLLEMRKVQEELEVERRKLIWEDRSGLGGARAKARNAREEYEAEKALLEQTGSVSRSMVAAKELALRQAEAEVEAYEMGERREEIEYRMAVEALENRLVRAPRDGVVAAWFVEEGEDARAREKVARLVDVRRFFFEAHIAESAAARLAVGREVSVALPVDGEERAFTGKLVFLSPVVDSASGLVRARLLCENREGRVRPGVAGRLLLPGEGE